MPTFLHPKRDVLHTYIERLVDVDVVVVVVVAVTAYSRCLTQKYFVLKGSSSPPARHTAAGDAAYHTSHVMYFDQGCFALPAAVVGLYV